MTKNYLKTSKLNLPEENELDKVTYLGDWCFDLDKKLKFKSKYHLTTEKNKDENFEYLLKLKKILQSLYKFLNLTHGINKDYNYWNFIIGPWLVNFSSLFMIGGRYLKSKRNFLVVVICIHY